MAPRFEEATTTKTNTQTHTYSISWKLCYAKSLTWTKAHRISFRKRNTKNIRNPNSIPLCGYRWHAQMRYDAFDSVDPFVSNTIHASFSLTIDYNSIFVVIATNSKWEFWFWKIKIGSSFASLCSGCDNSDLSF